MEYKELEKLALDLGFSYVTRLDASTLSPLAEVRDMCAANTCGMYGKNLACPPACGTLEECRERIGKYRFGILLQMAGQIEDSLDFEGMQEIEARHKKSFFRLIKALRPLYPDMLPLGAGCCTVCKTCIGPGGECRFPDHRISSLEAYGILVNDLCTKNGMKYYYGPGTMAYTSCCLLE